MQQDANKRMKAGQRRYKDDYNRWIRNAPKKIKAVQYVNLDRLPRTTSAAERLATKLYSRLLFAKTLPFRETDVTPATVTIDKDGIRFTELADQATVASKAKKAPSKDNRTQTNENEAEQEGTHAPYGTGEQIKEHILKNAKKYPRYMEGCRWSVKKESNRHWLL